MTALDLKNLVMTALCLFLAPLAFAQEGEDSDPGAETLHDMRLRQEEEENLQRVVSQPVTVNYASNCSTVELTRQRLRDLGAAETERFGDVTIEAGHGEVSIDGNSGSIDNSVNIQVVNPDERRCL